MPFTADPATFEALVADLLEQITLGHTPEDLFATIYTRLRGLVPYNRIAVALLHEQGTMLRLVACRTDGPESLKIGYADALAGSTLADLLQTGHPRIINDLEAYLETKPDSRSTRLIVREGMRSNLTLPLLANGKPIGVIFFSSRQTNSYHDGHAQLLRRLAGTIAITLERAHLLTTLAQQNQELLAASELKDRFLEKLRQEVDRLTAQIQQENVYLRDEIRSTKHLAEIVGQSQGMQQVQKAVRQVAPTISTVLILGETGTGKERIAQAVHDLSPRRDRLLVKVNCAALAPGLITSELFGHEAGAFTGATRPRAGRFEVAHQGSLFLDEIAEIPLETQVLLLRVLQERVIERVGSHEARPIDVRVIAATNRDLQQGVLEGWFRADLFYRLNVFPIRIPPLRERCEDVEPLVHHFLHLFATRMGKAITGVGSRTLEQLRSYHWPGNVRELENLIERATILCSGQTLEIDPTWLTMPTPLAPSSTHALAELERQTILDALRTCGGRIYGPTGAAIRLGLKPTTLYSKMKKHHITRQGGNHHCE